MPLLTDERPECTALNCDRPPVAFIRRSIDRTGWFGCAVHAPGMEAAFKIGLPGSESGSAWVEVTPVQVLD